MATIVSVSEQAITFRTKNGSAVTLTPVDFLQRFVQHVLPDRLKKIRHAGLYAASHVHVDLPHARKLLELPSSSGTPTPALDWRAHLFALTHRDVTLCPECGGHLDPQPLPAARAPPTRLVA